jgi:hypothetical protein
MGFPASEVGYTIATSRSETAKIHKNMWWHWGIKILFIPDIKYEQSRALLAVPRLPVGEFPENVHILINTLTVHTVEIWFF